MFEDYKSKHRTIEEGSNKEMVWGFKGRMIATDDPKIIDVWAIKPCNQPHRQDHLNKLEKELDPFLLGYNKLTGELSGNISSEYISEVADIFDIPKKSKKRVSNGAKNMNFDKKGPDGPK